MKLNGKKMLPETIADNGALRQSFHAYRRWVQSQGKEEPRLPGLPYTNDQLFFISFAQMWCERNTPEKAAQRIMSTIHPLGEARVLGVMRNSPDFARAFDCPRGAPMNPVK